MKKIIPTIFSYDKKEFSQKFEKLIKISKNLQIDFMDGKFVKSKSIQLSKIPNLRNYKNNFEAHLMVENPEDWISKLTKKGFKKIIFHYSSTNDVRNVIGKVKKENLFCWIAINPGVGVKKIFEFLGDVGGVLFMGVKPGKEHQDFIPNVFDKIKELRKFDKKIKIQVDGGVNEKNIKKLVKIGVNNFNSGSFISNAEKPKENFKKLKDLINGGERAK